MKGRILTENRIADFSAYLRSEEKSENTVEKYLRDVQAFAEYLGGAEITKGKVARLRSELRCPLYCVQAIRCNARGARIYPYHAHGLYRSEKR